MNKRGILYVISAPSGAGKSTILKRIISEGRNIRFSVSATTRAPRKGETDGVDYIYITEEIFNKMKDNQEFIEWTEYCGNFYGTPKAFVDKNLELGYDVILEIEVEGARNIKRIYPECVMIFVLPPSIKELERRIRKRGSEKEEIIKKRIDEAINEIKQYYIYDYVIVNKKLGKAIHDIKCIFNAEKHRLSRNSDIIERQGL